MPVDTGSDVSQRIMRAAKDLFFARGYANTSLRSIATEAGTSESGVLRVYGSKNGLLRALYASCWAEINERVDEAMVAAEEVDPDPRNLLLELIRTVWQIYQDDPRMMSFLLSHFGFRETFGLDDADGVDRDIDEKVRQEYYRYLSRPHELCSAVAESRPALAEAGVTAAALGHIFVSIIYGIQTSWLMAGRETDTSVPLVTMDEALAAAKSLIYPEMLVA